MATEEQVTEALKNVYDPEIGINIVDLGLVYDLEVQDSSVNVDLTLTSMGCPAGPMIVQQIEEEIESVEGVEDVSVKIVWSPAWNPSMMSEDAKMELGYL
ncbi:MAG: metal-sulfur cluster assembly factor [Chloroflexota bacterium]|nr:metal-sulfur cluster assembly factor [Chloroflexota bacterium]